MKNLFTFKNIFMVALILLCGLLLWKDFSGSGPDDANHAPITKAAKNRVDLDVQNIDKKIRQNGLKTALINDAKQVIGSTEDLTDSSKKEADSIIKFLRIQNKQLVSYTQVQSRTIDSFMKAVNYGDTLFKHDGEYAKISFNLPKQTFSLQYDAKVNLAEYWRRDWFLGPKKRYLEIWMTDTTASINGVKRLRVEPKPDNFALKIKGIGVYNGKHQEAYFGPGIEVETRRFEYEGQYLYDYGTSKWYPGFKVGYKLFEF